MPLAVRFATITEMFDKLTAKFPSETRPALMHKAEGKYKGIWHAELRNSVINFTCALHSLGVKRGDNVGLISENRPEWVIADLAIVSLGAVTVPLYPTLTPKQIEYIYGDAGVRFAIVSNQFQLAKLLKILPKVRTLRKIIAMSEKGVTFDRTVLSFAKLVKQGEEFARAHPDFYLDSIKRVKPDDLLTIIYTSGTTGDPKGVMLTHSNLASNMRAAAEVLQFDYRDTFLSFLPLSHSFEKMAGYLTALACGATIAYAESIETVAENLLEIRPTVMTAVPRFFERLHDKILKQVDSGTPLRQKIFHWAIDVGRRYAKAKKRAAVTLPLTIQHRIADVLVFEKFKQKTGGRIRFMVSGGAALGRDLGEFFEAIGIRVIEGYGLSESSPVIAANRLDDYKIGTVGKPIPGIEVKIAEDGEILTRGPHVMKGYWKDKRGTHQAIDGHGWLHTGDIGLFDPDGFLVITDRKKHLFVSSGGKNIAPQPLENLFQRSKYIDQFVLIGDKRMFLSALIVPDFDAIKEYADKRKIAYRNEEDLVRSPEIYKVIESDIQSLQKDLANYERVRRFILLDRPFTIENGEMTPSLKVRRKVVEEKFRHLIEKMYRSVA